MGGLQSTCLLASWNVTHTWRLVGYSCKFQVEKHHWNIEFLWGSNWTNAQLNWTSHQLLHCQMMNGTESIIWFSSLLWQSCFFRSVSLHEYLLHMRYTGRKPHVKKGLLDLPLMCTGNGASKMMTLHSWLHVHCRIWHFCNMPEDWSSNWMMVGLFLRMIWAKGMMDLMLIQP